MLAYPEGFSGSGTGFEPLPANCLSVNLASSFPAVIVIMTLRSAPVFAFIYPLIEPFPLPDVLLNVHQVSLLEACHVPSASEAPNKAIARKSIVAAREIKAGEVFTEENLTTKRPGDGISPMRWHEILGQTAKRDFAEDEKIEV